MPKIDIYSLGCIFLHILTAIYYNNEETEKTAAQRNIAREARFRSFLAHLKATNSNSPYHLIFPHGITKFGCSMLENGPILSMLRRGSPDLVVHK